MDKLQSPKSSNTAKWESIVFYFILTMLKSLKFQQNVHRWPITCMWCNPFLPSKSSKKAGLFYEKYVVSVGLCMCVTETRMALKHNAMLSLKVKGCKQGDRVWEQNQSFSGKITSRI